jgi:acyl carrier protein
MAIGRPIANTRVYILDRGLNPVPVGVLGEMFVEAAHASRGYLHRASLTAERFVPNPFNPVTRLYRTGDVGRYLVDGEIEYLGRTDYQVKVRGIRIEPAEIEAVLEAHDDITQAVVVAQDIGGRSRLVAYVVGCGGAVGVSELRRFVRSRLPEYMVPAIFVLLDRLPLTPRGKIDRRALPLPSATRPDLETPYTPPRTPLEDAMAQTWANVLRVDQVGVDDHFLELGGDSLTAVQLVTDLARQFGVELPVLTLFRCPTVGLLAQEIR